MTLGVHMAISREKLSLYVLKGLQFGMWGISALTFFSAVMLVATPCLLPFLTLGACLMQDSHEYFDYALTSLNMAIFPLIISAITGLIGYGLRLSLFKMEQNAKHAQVEQLDAARMRTLSKQHSRQLST